MTKSSENRKNKRAGKQRLAKQKKLTSAEVHSALTEASRALDSLQAENGALRRIIVSERAQLMYYMGNVQAFNAGTRILGSLVGFMDLGEEQKQEWIKKAIEELGKGDIEPAKLADAYGREVKPN